MVRYTMIILILLSVFNVVAQDTTELERRNGFKDIKLTMKIDSLKGAKFKKDIKENEFPAKLYVVEHPDYQKIGEVEVKKVEVKAYKDLIYEITVIAEKDPRLMKALESIYGKSDYDMKNETYFWKAKDLSLKFRSHSKNQLEMIYYSYRISSMMKADREKKVENIADDF
jgi:hypothetical protein